MASSTVISDSTSAARRTLLFRLGDAVYGCDIGDIREIIPYRKTTRLPGAPPAVRGLINLRGTIVTVLDLAARLAPGQPPVAEGSIILVGAGTRLTGVAVEEVLDVRMLGTDASAAPADVPAGDGVVRGLARVDDTTVVLLDIHKLVRHVLQS